MLLRHIIYRASYSLNGLRVMKHKTSVDSKTEFRKGETNCLESRDALALFHDSAESLIKVNFLV